MSASGQPLRKLTVMIVDDDPDVLETISAIIRRLGHAVLPLDKAREVIKHVARGKADLLLLDINMPGTSGLDVLKVLRRRRMMIPTIIVSGHISSEIAQQLAELSISGVVAKPFTRERLEAEINKAMGL